LDTFFQENRLLVSLLSCQVSGYGLALVGVSIEQDASYWEAHVILENGTLDAYFGVATRKDQQFYRALEQDEGKF